MKNRRRIAVLMASVFYKAYQHLFLNGILSQAFALDYDVVIFSPFMNYDNSTAYQRGENRVFDLIDFDQFDAVIYAPCSFFYGNLRELVEQILDERCHIPIVSLESTEDDPKYDTVLMDDFHAFGKVVDHLIEEHGLKKIYCLTGFKDNLIAEERQRGYRDSMARHGLPVPEGYVIYGDFWKFKAAEVAEDIAAHRMEQPEAVVCCCDTVAITLCNRLIELGYRVPEDIVIASYDVGDQASDNVPSITTYMRPIKDLGIRGMLRAHEKITGEKAEPVFVDKGYLIPAESCGCGKDFKQKFEERQKEIRDTEEFRKLFDDTPMAESLNSKQVLNQLLYNISEHFYLINGLQEYYLCLCDGWDDLSKNTDNVADYDNYTETMHLSIAHNGIETFLEDYPFPLSDLLPALHEDRAEPRAYYITPLHFNERCFGYAALSFGNQPMAFDSLYHAWSRNVNNALEFMRVRNNFNSMNQRLLTSSMRDTLTGIYNRHGYAHFADIVYAKAVEGAPEKKLLVIAADLDCLKIINDTYGHLEGDNAINMVATALNTCIGFGEICARTGGDEFLMIGCADYTEETVQNYLHYIRDFLDRYNAESGKPYEVGASLGYVCRAVTPEDSLAAITEEADALMYQNKILRKKNRQ